MGPRLDVLATREVPSLEGTGRIQASSTGVQGDAGTRAPLSTEVLAASLSTIMEEGLVGCVRTDYRGDLGRFLESQIHHLALHPLSVAA